MLETKLVQKVRVGAAGESLFTLSEGKPRGHKKAEKARKFIFLA